MKEETLNFLKDFIGYFLSKQNAIFLNAEIDKFIDEAHTHYGNISYDELRKTHYIITPSLYYIKWSIESTFCLLWTYFIVTQQKSSYFQTMKIFG